ncbi:MAG: murein biosynthesis integral membrane protein MurJ [Candidatus Magasanikbacteria bacterium]
MIKQALNGTTKSITGAAIILGAASFLSRLMGIVRDRIFAHYFGAGDVLDAYYAAFRIPDMVYNLLIVGALSAGFIPVFMKVVAKNKEEAWKVTNSILNILGIGLLIVCGILFIFTPQVMQLIVPGFSGEKMEMTVMLTRIMFLSPILLGISSVVSGVLQSFKSFAIYSLTPIMYNLGIIIGAVFFVPIWNVKGLAYGVLLGALLHLLIQLPTFFKYGFKYKPLMAFQNKHVRQIGKLMIPRTLGLATSQLNLVAITAIASTLAVGSVAVFNFASNLQYFPIGIIGISFAVAAFPTLSGLIAEKKQDEMIDHLSHTMRQILFFIVPLTILFLLLRAQIVRVVLGTGMFDWEATILTADTLAFFSLSLFAQCLIPLLARGFYAVEDTWTPFLASLVGMLVTVIAALQLKDLYGIAGIALGFSIGVILQLCLLWIILRSKLGTLGEAKIVNTLLKISGAALIMALTVQLLKEPLASFVNMEKFWGVALQGTLSGLAGLIVYAGLCYIFKVQEMIEFGRSFKKRFLKLKDYQGEVGDADKI